MKQKKFVLKPTVLGLSASLGLSATLLVACGGGGPSSIGSNETSASASSSNPLIDRAKAVVNKKVYTLGSTLGAYGEILRKDGYSFVQVGSLHEVPANPTSILYFAGADVPLGLEASQLRSFKGVVVVDSNQLAKAGAGEASADSEEASVQENEGEGESPAAKLYRTLMGDSSIPMPNSTAFMTSTVINTIFPLDVDASGRVNGFEASDLAFVGPQAYAMSAKDVADGKASRAMVPNRAGSSGRDKAMGLDISANTDKVIDIIATSDGYRLVGRGYIWATKETGPAFLSARKWVDILVDTGSNESGCAVLGTNCGVYPIDKWQAIKSTSSTGTGEVSIKVTPHTFYAEARVKPWYQTMTWAPKASTWTTESTYNDNAYETTSSSGWAVGGSAGFSTAGSFSVGPSASYTKSVTVQKKTYVWNGYESSTTQTDANNVKTGILKTGIKSANLKVRGAVDTAGSLYWKNNQDEAQHVSMFDMFVGGRYCKNVWTDDTGSKYCNFSGTQTPLGDGSPRGHIAYSGWTPTIRAAMEIPTGYFESTTSTKVVTVTMGLGLTRDILIYDRVSNLDLCDNWYGYRLKGTTNLNCTADNVVTPSSTNRSFSTLYKLSTWSVPVGYFTNAN